jgi:signal transduction histidine kinase
VTLTAAQDTNVQFEVRDRGIGIADVDQERIFGRFERLSNHPAGAGVGLWLVRGLVESHGGSIAVHSASAQGATFTVILPLDADSQTQVHHDPT